MDKGRVLNTGELINVFDNLAIQNVEEFNKLFPHCPLGTWQFQGTRELVYVEYPKEWLVEILDMVAGNTRRIRLNNEIILHEMPLRTTDYRKKSNGYGKPVIINGLIYDSIAHASLELGMTRYNIIKQAEK